MTFYYNLYTNLISLQSKGQSSLSVSNEPKIKAKSESLSPEGVRGDRIENMMRKLFSHVQLAVLQHLQTLLCQAAFWLIGS